MIRLGLLVLVPLAPALYYGVGLSPLWVFVAGVAGVGVALIEGRIGRVCMIRA